MKLQPKCATTTIGGKPIASYCRFRIGARWYMTHRFESPDGGEVSVDVDKDNMPIGLQWINVAGARMQQRPKTNDPSTSEDFLGLFTFASQLALFGDNIQSKQAKPILRKVVESLSTLKACA